ncbi:hypothetical protein AAEX28_13435 [Lentisphaerota bacterium WC36G]|nr:hypothetical protein LJT99_00190 [Lentisphaerae bacterium WC36]
MFKKFFLTGAILSSSLVLRASEVNWDFTNKQLHNWKVVEGKGNVYGSKKRDYKHSTKDTILSTLYVNGRKSDRPKITLMSPVFKITDGKLEFWLGGGNKNVGLEIYTLKGEKIYSAVGHKHISLKKFSFDPKDYRNQELVMMLFDRSSGSWGHITLADVKFKGKVFPGKKVDLAEIAKQAKLQKQIKKYQSKIANIQTLRDSINYLADKYPNYNKTKYLKLVNSFAAKIKGKKIAVKDVSEFITLQKTVMLSHPFMQQYPMLYNQRAQYLSDHHNTATLFQKGEINTHKFRGNSSFKTVNFSEGLNPVPKIILDKGANTAARDPEISYDGKEIVFSMRTGKNGNYHIYKMNANGKNIKQLTKADYVSDIDPVFLPDDSIVFSSTREPKFCMCNRHIMVNLFKMNTDGSNIHQIGKSTLFEGRPQMLSDGRIIYDRWEYVDRNFGDAQALWVTNQDGTNHAIYWGNNTPTPGAVIDARQIPGTDLVVCIFGSCHDRPWGAIAIIDNKKAIDGPEAVVQIWPKEAINLVSMKGNERWDNFKYKLKVKYEDPFPIDSQFILASKTTGDGDQTFIVLLDRFGNEAEILRDGIGAFEPMLIKPSKKPPVIASRRNFENGDATVYVQDVYIGTHMKGVKRGDVKYLRVVESPEKRSWSRQAWYGLGEQAPGVNWHDLGTKKILGTVPVEEDGSAYFKVPSDKFVFFQLLDKNKKMIQTMRSGTVFQSGEIMGCVGCHESRTNEAPPIKRRVKALSKAPHALTGFNGKIAEFNYLKEVQPIFDKNCVSCHDFGKNAGKKLNLARDKSLVFNISYHELWKKKYVRAIGSGPAQILQPYTWGAHKSKLISLLEKGHKNIKLSDADMNKIITWIDINAPYYKTYNYGNYGNNLGGRCPLTYSELKRLTKLTGINYSRFNNMRQKVGPQITFDRPEMSPALTKFAKNSAEYKEILNIIKAGAKRLEENPRADMENFKPSKEVLLREKRYKEFLNRESKNREAIRNNNKNYDKTLQK